MKKCIYAKLHEHIPNTDELVSRLNKIGFRFTKAANNRWAYAAQNSQEQKYFEPGATDEAIEAMIKTVNGYQLLALLRERLPSQTRMSADEEAFLQDELITPIWKLTLQFFLQLVQLFARQIIRLFIWRYEGPREDAPSD